MKTIYTNSNKTIQKALFVLFIFILLTQYGYSQFSATEIRINSTPSTTNSCGGGLLGTVFTDSHHDTTTLLGVVTGYKYGINENYTKTICSDNGGTLSIDFTSLGIDNNDHLKVYDGPNTSSAQIYDFTNTGTAPGAVYSTGTCLTFVFTSDANTPSFFGQSRSWSGTVSCVVINKVNDPTTVTGCGSLFTDDGGPNQNYAGNQTSIKTFCPGTAGGCLLATFSQFDLESANDKLEVYDGSTATGTPIATYTGSTIPADINPSKGNCLTFKFTTNGTVQNKGWVAIISCPTSCAPPCNPNSPPASDNCSDAPPICDLNGYCGTTKNGPPNGYCPDYPGNFTSAGGSSSTAPCNISHASTSGSNLFSGSIENNSWLKFVASDVTATFNVYVTNCVPTSGGIQMGIYQGTNCNNFALMSPFGLTGAGITGTSQITGTGLTAGNVYYIMVDGISGAVCNYTVEAVSGVQMGSSISQDQTICLGQSALIDVSTIGGIIATWSSNPVDPNMPASGNNIAVSPTQTTTYSTHVTSTNGFCTFDTTLTTTVTVLQANDPLCQQNVQCTINVAANPTTVCSGEPVDITSDGNIVRTLLANTFNSGTVGVGWVGGTTANFTNPCNTPLPFGTTFLWMDDAAAAPRTLATNNFDVSNGATISFWMRFAIQGGTAPCEGPDMPGEGVSLQYSTTNGSTWQDITYFSPGGTQMTTNPDPNYTQTANGNALVTTGQTTPFTAWARYSFAIPIAAQTTATRFRWFQKNSTALNTDNWGIDSVMIVTPPLQIGIAWHSNPTASAADLITTNIVGTTNNETIHPTQTAWYVAEISDGSASCKDSVQVNVLTALVANAGSDVTTCSGVSSQLNATPAGATSCSWTSLPTGFTSNIANPTVNPTITTTYIVNVNNNGCTGTDQVVVNINSAVTAEAGNNISICPDGNAQLSASPNNATSYSWTSNTDNFTSTIFNPTVTPSANTTYTVNINNNGCTGSDIVTVTIRNLPAISAGNDVTICAGVPTSLTASNGLTYKWSNAGETTTSISVSPSIESTYTVTGTDVNGCSNID
ncbi:MAG: CUB domain-containing protein, partial [Bacteroidota bacterium]